MRRALLFLGVALAGCSRDADHPSRLPGATVRSLTRDAQAQLKRARITQDPADLRHAERSIEAALALAPDDYGARCVEAVALASAHRFEEALERARALARIAPHAALPYGVMTDALVELGRYDEAVEAAQALADHRPGPASLTRASYLRSLHGDREGSIALMRQAVDASMDPAEKSWCLVHLAQEQLAAGRAGEAREACERALALHPGYALAELTLARVLAASGQSAAAEVRLRARLATSPDDADSHLQVAELRLAAGDPDDARAHLDAAERLERAELAAASGTDAHHLLDVLLLRGDRREEALARATRDASRRRDLATCLRLSRALAAVGRTEEAKRAADDAMRTGTDDPSLLAQAGLVAAAAGDSAAARARLHRALERSAGLSPLLARRSAETLARLEKS